MQKETKRKSTLIDYLLGFEKFRLSPGWKKRISEHRRFKEKQINTVGGRMPRLLQRNPIVRLFKALSDVLMATAFNMYGAFLLSFGLSTLLVNSVIYYILHSARENFVFALFIGAFASLLSIPFLMSASPFGILLQKPDTVARRIFDLFCFRRSDNGKEKKGLRLSAVLPFGIGLAALEAICPLSMILTVFLCLIYLFLVAASPEFSFLLLFLLTPIFPILPKGDVFLAGAVLVTFLSYFGKALCGKRLLCISVYDNILILAAFMFLIDGLMQKGSYSFLSALLLCCILLGHLLASNLFISPNICRSAFFLFLFSSIPTSVYGICDYFIRIARGAVYEEQMNDFFLPHFAEVTGAVRARAAFSSPDLYAGYLVLCIILSFTLLSEKRRLHTPGVLCILSLSINLLALFCTVSHEAWLSLLLGYAAYRIFRSRKINNRLSLLLFAVPIAFLLIPADAYRSVEDLSFFPRLNFAPILSAKEAASTVFSEIKENLLFGIGRLNFSPAFPEACPGILSLIKAVGILAAIPLFLLFPIRLSHMQRYSRWIPSSSVRSTILLSSGALFCLFALMIGTDLFAESILLYLFCAFLGMGNAALRLSHEEMREKSYYDLENSADTAEAEIPIAEDA